MRRCCFRKGKEIRVCLGKSLWSHSSGGRGPGISLKSQLLAQVLTFSWWNEQQSDSCNELFMQWVLTSGNQKGASWRMPNVTAAGKRVWLRPELLLYACGQSSPSTDWLKRGLILLYHFFPFSLLCRKTLPCHFILRVLTIKNGK